MVSAVGFSPEQGQVGTVEEHWSLEVQLSNGPELCLCSFGGSL